MHDTVEAVEGGRGAEGTDRVSCDQASNSKAALPSIATSSNDASS